MMVKRPVKLLPELRKLHSLYDKHVVKKIADVSWGEERHPVHMCSCGHFVYRNVGGMFGANEMFVYDNDTCTDWVVSTFETLKGEYRAAFVAQLKRKRYRFNDAYSAKLVLGIKGQAVHKWVEKEFEDKE